MLPHAFQSLLVDAGAEILYFATYADSIVKDGKIEAVIVETPVGRAARPRQSVHRLHRPGDRRRRVGAPVKRDEAYMGLAAWMGGVDVKTF